jgi:hypothetical protein
LSLVGYVRLPAEGYAQYLQAFALRVQLHMLEAARKDAEPLFAQPPPSRDTFVMIERRLRERIAQLEGRMEDLGGAQDKELRAECAGLLASSGKSLAEVYFVRARHYPEEKSRLDALSRAALQDSLKWYSEVSRRDLSAHWHGIQKLALEVALTGRISDPAELMIVRRVAQAARDANEDEYWACGTLAEAILLGSLTSEPGDLTGARAALDLLRERSGRDAKDHGFAARSTRRQLARYVSWWTKGNGYFPGCESDISAHARALVECLPMEG